MTKQITEREGSLWSAPVARLADRTKVAPEAPAALLSIAPDGEHAVGRYTEGDAEALFGFRLDGRAARRKLVAGIPVAWSADSTWLLVDATDEACALRAAGGEYKCWQDYRALGIGPAYVVVAGLYALSFLLTLGVSGARPRPLPQADDAPAHGALDRSSPWRPLGINSMAGSLERRSSPWWSVQPFRRSARAGCPPNLQPYHARNPARPRRCSPTFPIRSFSWTDVPSSSRPTNPQWHCSRASS